ncbi:MAG: hypothetical protein R3F48_12650 [Candidatus Zixiibacteriota bacterium]
MELKNRLTWEIVCALILCIIQASCSNNSEEGWNPFLSSSGTGVRGLDTPDQILSNPYVEEGLEDAEEKGVVITPEKASSPPVISGTYDFSGQNYVPIYGWGQLAPGTWQWKNQTADNHIDTEYDQIGVQTGSGGGEIIRGEGSEFTVYSVLEIDDVSIGGCEDRAVALIDGTQKNNGDISAVYIVVPVNSNSCHSTTFGRIELTLTGAKKVFSSGESSPAASILRGKLQELFQINKTN